MVRSMAAFIAGLLVMLIVVSSIQWIGHTLYPSPPVLDAHGTVRTQSVIAQAPFGFLAIVLLSYATCSFLAAGTASTLSLRHKRGVAIFLGVVMTGIVAVHVAVVPHPLWVIVVGLLLPIPFALLGWRTFR